MFFWKFYPEAYNLGTRYFLGNVIFVKIQVMSNTHNWKINKQLV